MRLVSLASGFTWVGAESWPVLPWKPFSCLLSGVCEWGGVAVFLGGRPEGCRLDWPIGLAAGTKIHKNISSLGHVGVCFPPA